MADTPTFMGDWQETHFSDQTGFSYLDSLPSLTPFLESTEHPEKVCTWLREISSCSCLTVLPGPAWVLLSKKYILFPGALYYRFTL